MRMSRRILYAVIVVAVVVATAVEVSALPTAAALTLLAATFVALLQIVAERNAARLEASTAVAHLETRICELQQRSKEISVLAEMSEQLHVSTSVSEAMQFVPSFGRRLFPSFSGSVSIVDPSGEQAGIATAWGAPPDARTFNVEDCQALRRAPHGPAAVRMGGCRHDGETDATPRLCVPISVGEGVGVLSLRSASAADVTAEVESVATAFADQLSLALTTLHLHDALRMRATRDALTGLFNRRYIEENIADDISRWVRNGASVGLILLDVDWFKSFNDAFGHAGGDALLQQLARLMQAVVRNEDFVCRYGGEEFMIVLPDATLETTRLCAERLREHTHYLKPHLHDEPLGPVTISAGVASTSDHGHTLDALAIAADRALYEAKRAGRDRVMTASGRQIVAA
jgi:diguanylate cyclase (GGDEF)-like protein